MASRIDDGRKARGPRFKDLTGLQLKSWTVLEFSHKNKHCHSYWSCRCVCGTVKAVNAADLLRPNKCFSCGCLTAQKMREHLATHGLSHHPLYGTWIQMIHRCYNPEHHAYHNYGGRGISVCKRWRDSVAAFIADMGERPSSKHTIERIDCNSGYRPGNCCWASRGEQRRNRRDTRLIHFDGESLCVTDWALRVGLSECCLRRRLKNGWAVDRALTTPARR